MEFFKEAFVIAIKLLFSFDRELYGIVLLSLKISTISVLISSIIGIPLGTIISLKKFKGKTMLINIINTFMGLPPVVVGLTIVAVHGISAQIQNTAVSLGASKTQLVWTLIREAKYSIGASVIVAFGRLLAEVGAVMMVGGNIRFQTRVMTTAIALHKGMGELQQALALGMILIFISFLINLLLDIFRKGKVYT